MPLTMSPAEMKAVNDRCDATEYEGDIRILATRSRQDALMLRKELDAVTAQRDELLKVINRVRTDCGLADHILNALAAESNGPARQSL